MIQFWLFSLFPRFFLLCLKIICRSYDYFDIDNGCKRQDKYYFIFLEGFECSKVDYAPMQNWKVCQFWRGLSNLIKARPEKYSNIYAVLDFQMWCQAQMEYLFRDSSYVTGAKVSNPGVRGKGQNWSPLICCGPWITHLHMLIEVEQGPQQERGYCFDVPSFLLFALSWENVVSNLRRKLNSFKNQSVVWTHNITRVTHLTFKFYRIDWKSICSFQISLRNECFGNIEKKKTIHYNKNVLMMIKRIFWRLNVLKLELVHLAQIGVMWAVGLTTANSN